ncbi:hypothetical protein ABLE68_13785 [Nocardioides sp. CN2-186]|uniref:calcium-binding protein n=1 Tax=Nocardioides tweenelious TaxID=3156607 RepID=UPI0032B3CFF1
MRHLLVLTLLVLPLLTVSPAADAAPTCGGKRATMVFGDGDDYVFGTSGDDVVVLGAGDDTYQQSGGGHDLVCGGAGTDYIDVGVGRAEVWGGPGDDDFLDRDAPAGRRGAADLFHGGPGHDRLAFTGPAISLTVADGHEVGNERDAFTGVEGFMGTFGDDVFVGTSRADDYYDNGGSDEITTGGGNDAVDIVRGRSVVHMGAGDDTVTVSFAYGAIHTGSGDDRIQVGASNPEVVDGGPGTDTIGLWYDDEGATIDLAAATVTNATVGAFPIAGIEDVDGSPGDDTIYGDDGPNRLFGSGGQDTVDGRGGNDVCDAEVMVSC